MSEFLSRLNPEQAEAAGTINGPVLVLAGAGIGILSVQAAYWLYPAINRTLFKKRADSMVVTPFADGNGYGLTCSVTF